jgi:hypothetical protein
VKALGEASDTESEDGRELIWKVDERKSTWEKFNFRMFKMTLMPRTLVEASLTLLKETTFGNLFKRIPIREFLEIKFLFWLRLCWNWPNLRKVPATCLGNGLTPNVVQFA